MRHIIIDASTKSYFWLTPGVMMMELLRTSFVKDIQQKFTSAYPFLCLEFYTFSEGRFGASVRKKASKSATLANLGMKQDGRMQISDAMSVRALEETLHREFGLNVQVARKSGTVWLETTMTDNWTLGQQNIHGRDLSEALPKPKTEEF